MNIFSILLTFLFTVTAFAESTHLYKIEEGEVVDLSKIAFFTNYGLEKEKVKLTSDSIGGVRMDWTTRKYKKWIAKATLIGESGSTPATLQKISIGTHEMDSEKFKLFSYDYRLKNSVETRFSLLILRDVKVKNYKTLQLESTQVPLETLLKAWTPKESSNLPHDFYDQTYEIKFESPGKVSVAFPLKGQSISSARTEKFSLNQCKLSKYGTLTRIICPTVSILSEENDLIFISANSDTSGDYIPYMFANIDGVDHIVHSGFQSFASAIMKKDGKWIPSTLVKIYHPHE
jgi:hypothetical protein